MCTCELRGGTGPPPLRVCQCVCVSVCVYVCIPMCTGVCIYLAMSVPMYVKVSTCLYVPTPSRSVRCRGDRIGSTVAWYRSQTQVWSDRSIRYRTVPYATGLAQTSSRSRTLSITRLTRASLSVSCIVPSLSLPFTTFLPRVYQPNSSASIPNLAHLPSSYKQIL